MLEQTSFNTVVPAFSYMNADTTAACLQALFKDSPVATVALDAHHRFVMCNRAFENLYRFSPDELMASDLDELITGPSTRDEASGLSRAVLRGEKVHLVTQRCRRDGMTVDVEIDGIPLIVGGIITGVVALYQDITERNRAQAAYRQLSYKLDSLQQEDGWRSTRDLHDSRAQELAVLNWNLSHLQRKVGDADPELQKLVQETKELAVRCSSHIRTADRDAASAKQAATQKRSSSLASVTGGLPGESETPARSRDTQSGLTAREREVLVLLAEGMTSKQIASKFGISARTIESHRIHINHKLGFDSLAELVRYAMRHGFIA